MSLRLGQTGPTGHPTAVSQLIHDGVRLAVGYGKGAGLQAVVSAHFEALERYFMSTTGNRRLADGAAAVLTAKEVSRQAALQPDLVIQRWAAEFPESGTACTAYHGDRSSVWYPIFLCDPRYHRHPLPGDSVNSYRSLLRYTSSLGTAAGANATEAVLHGLCELIEHDGLSHALLRWFIAGIAEIDIVAPESLPDRLRTLWRETEDAVGAPVYLIDVTTDLSVPVYLAVPDGDGTRPSPFGAGASPLAAYAAERALSELVQSTGLGDTAAGTGAGNLAAWPDLRDCALLPIRRLLTGRIRQVPLRANLTDAASVDAALDRVAGQLHSHELEYYHVELTPADSLVSVATVVAPGLERFSLVHLGLPVVPTGRGWSLWAAARLARSAG